MYIRTYTVSASDAMEMGYVWLVSNDAWWILISRNGIPSATFITTRIIRKYASLKIRHSWPVSNGTWWMYWYQQKNSSQFTYIKNIHHWSKWRFRNSYINIHQMYNIWFFENLTLLTGGKWCWMHLYQWYQPSLAYMYMITYGITTWGRLKIRHFWPVITGAWWICWYQPHKSNLSCITQHS